MRPYRPDGAQIEGRGATGRRRGRFRPMPVRVLQLLVILVAALALAGPVAHLASFLSKIGLERDAYFTAQAAYAGWWVLGLSWPVALLLNLWLAWRLRGQRPVARLATGAALTYAVMLGVFVIWTQPANRATGDWTLVVENWAALREAWEYSHLVNAALAFLALGLTTCSALLWRDPDAQGGARNAFTVGRQPNAAKPPGRTAAGAAQPGAWPGSTVARQSQARGARASCWRHAPGMTRLRASDPQISSS